MRSDKSIVTENVLPYKPSALGPSALGPAAAMFTNVPDDLKELDQAVLWKYATRDGSTTKVPYQINGKPASTTDPATWGTFDDVQAVYQRYPKRYSGSGIVFSPDDPYCGIDLDGCIDDAGALKSWAQPIIATFGDTYMEISPSGHGIKIWCKATLPGAGRSKKDEAGEGIEIYDRGRYFTVTGNAFNGAPPQIEDHQKDVERLYALVAGSQTGKPQPIDGKIPHGQQHTTLVSLAGTMRRRGMGAEAIFAALWETNTSQCEVPGPAENIRRIAESACRNWQPDPSANVFRGQPEADAGDSDAAQATAAPPGTQQRDFLCNETGNADRLSQRYGDDLAHCEQREGYMVWTGKVWRFDKFVLSERMAEETMREALSDAGNITDDKARGLFLKFVSGSLSRKGLANMAHLAKKKVRQVDTTDFDKDPFLLNCHNGTIDLRRGELRPHRKDDLLSKLIPLDYDPAAKCPLFLRTLYRIMGDSPDATEAEVETAGRLVAYLQRLFGCAATGKPEKLLVVFYGPTGDNGKTTLLTIINKALGDKEYTAQVNIESLMVDPKGAGMSNAVNSDLSDLQGCRFVFSSEVERGQRLALSRVKYLTGLTSIKARRMRENWIEFTPTWKIFMDCNDRPVISSPSDAIWNRVKCVPFTVKLSEAEKDSDLPAKLEPELPGILAWIVAGARDYVAHGLGSAPPEVDASTEEYRKSSDRLKEFIEPVPITIEPHYSPKVYAELFSLSESTVLKWFRDMPGVLKYGKESRNGKRTRVEIKIPYSVWLQVYSEKTR